MNTIRKYTATWPPTILGYVAGGTASFTNAIAGASVQLLYGIIPPFQLNLGRYTTQVVVSLLLALVFRTGLKVEPTFWSWFGVTAICSNAVNILYFTASGLIPLGNQVVVQQMTMFVSSALVSRFILKNSVPTLHFVLILPALVGGVLVTQPSPPFKSHVPSYTCFANRTNNATTFKQVAMCEQAHALHMTFATMETVGYSFTVIAALFEVCISFIYRCRLSQVNPISASCWISLSGVVPSAALIIYFERPVLVIDYRLWFSYVGHCLGTTASSILNIPAQQLLTPLAFTLVSSMRLVFNCIVQFCFPSLFVSGQNEILELGGAVLIVITTLASSWFGVLFDKVNSVS